MWMYYCLCCVALQYVDVLLSLLSSTTVCGCAAICLFTCRTFRLFPFWSMTTKLPSKFLHKSWFCFLWIETQLHHVVNQCLMFLETTGLSSQVIMPFYISAKCVQELQLAADQSSWLFQQVCSGILWLSTDVEYLSIFLFATSISSLKCVFKELAYF